MNRPRCALRLLVLGTLLPWAALAPSPVLMQSNCISFPETQHRVCGTFLRYWQAHGGLEQQGYPISPEFPERNASDGRIYTVQYFERAVFEYHPENAGTPYDILLAQLGTYQYQQMYPTGAPGQRPNSEHPLSFPGNRYTIGGAFRTYWEQHGGLVQQGFPISDEFTEISRLNGKPYTVQYFERAVFEYHPENAPASSVQLSLLGSTALASHYHPLCNQCGAGGDSAHVTPPPDADFTCDVRGTRNGAIGPFAVRGNESASISAKGFAPTEPVLYSLTAPNGQVVAQEVLERVQGMPGEFRANLNAKYWWVSGRWVLTLTGTANHRQAVLPFCVYTGANTHVWPLIQRGLTGPLVQAVQLLLRVRGYDLSGTGNFLNYTEAAVTAFQTRQGLPSTGKVDAPTWDALLVPLAYGDRGDAVRALQSLLAPDFPDNHDGPGVFGADTLHALNEFETRNNIPAQQTVDREVWYQVVRHAPTAFR
jgi:hypothetical protein